MTETQRRIRAYKRALPHMRERVIAVAMLLVMSLTMMTSASFAWLTLSRSPEVSSITTTVAANGNLEIALSDTDGLQPDESKVGDGNTDDVSISNLTWGNLINLAHDSYGLNQLTLRPASLNTNDLTKSPVYAVEYGEDGRVKNYINEFAFTNYAEVENSGVYKFTVLDEVQYGVRAVSSVKYENITGNATLNKKVETINRDNAAAKTSFEKFNDSGKMQIVGDLVGVHVTYTLNGGIVVCNEYMEDLMILVTDLKNCMQDIGQVIVDIINLYEYIEGSGTEYSFNDLFYVGYSGSGTFGTQHLNNAVLDKYVDKLGALPIFKRAWVDIVKAYVGVDAANTKYANGSGPDVQWKAHLLTYVDLLCGIETAEMNGMNAGDLDGNAFAAMGLLLASKHSAVIMEGVIKDADQLTMISEKNKMSVPQVNVTVSYMNMNPTLKPDITTAASGTGLLRSDAAAAELDASKAGPIGKGDPVAADTYAMAIDFWLRTNASNSLLILEGDYITEEVPITDADGKQLKDEEGNLLFETSVTGYGGVNRVWDELDDPSNDVSNMINQMGGTSATQGSGSCYIFYPENPEDQAQSLNMLRAMRVAFVDAEGNLLAQADMDADNAVQDSGRIIVPLRLSEKAPVELEDGKLETQYVMEMPQNEAQRITAIVYLDGEILTNSKVLEAGSITGQLNIQFGTTDLDMTPMKDNEVMLEYYTIDVISGNAHYDGYDEATKCETTVKIAITGTDPTSVKGNFISIISNTQGAREETFIMTKGEDGYWTANVPFSGPGSFELRSIQIDGVDVLLDETVEVEIDGLKITSLLCTDWSNSNVHSVMTADSSYSQEMILSVGSSDFHQIRGVFIGDNGQNVSVNFTKGESNLYHGSAIFNSSGTYEMTYLEIDGSLNPLAPSLYKTITLQLGLRSYVEIGEPKIVGGIEDEDILSGVTGDALSGWSFMYNRKQPLEMAVRCTIIGDKKEIKGLENVTLTYGMPGSFANVVDANVVWNEDTGYYEGTMQFQHLGIYKFRQLGVKQGDNTSYITTASNAPTITSKSPYPVEYVPLGEMDPLTFKVGGERSFKIKLKNADAATLTVELTKEGDSTPVVIEDCEGIPNGDITTFTIPVPSDGKWTITGVTASNVVYNNALHENLDLTVLEGANEISEGKISTYFLTEVDVNVTGAPNETTYNGEFMEDHPVENMVITVTNQGQPLTRILDSVGKTDTNVSVSMKYEWDESNLSYEHTDGTLPPHDFGGVLIANNSGSYPMGKMNFKLAGKYEPIFELTIGDEVYSEAHGNLESLNVDPRLKNTAKVTVVWNPIDIQVSNVVPAKEVEITYNAGTDSRYTKGTATNDFSTYNATVYTQWVQTSGGCGGTTNSLEVSKVELKLVSGASSNSAITLTVNPDSGNPFSYEFNSNGDAVLKEVGSYQGTTRKNVGVKTIGSVTMQHEGVTYTIPLANSITITQEH